MATTRDYVKLHFIVFLWGFTAILGVLISIPAVELVFLRTLIAAVGVGVLLLFLKKTFYVPLPDFLKLLGTGVLVSAHWITFFASARVSNVSVSLVGFATASLWTAFLEPLSHGKKIKKLEVFLGCLVIAGLYIILYTGFQFRLGLLLGVLAGLTTACFSVINSKLIQRVNAYSITFYEMLSASIATALFFPFYKSFFTTPGELNLSPSGIDWFYISILSLVCTVYAFSVMTELMKRVSVFFIQLTINLEPVYGIIMAVFFFKEKEKMNVSFYIGTLIILSAVLAYPFLKRKLRGYTRSVQ